MITFTIGERRATKAKPEQADHAAVDWSGQRFASEATRGSALMRCARQLVAAGCEDQSWQACGHDGQRRLFGGSLHRLAKLTVTEDQKGGLRFAAYVPFPGVRSDATAVSGAAEG